MRSTLLLASLLAVVPVVSASPTRSLAARQAIPTINLGVPVSNGTYEFIDCYNDSETNRLLVHSGTPDGPLTVERCALACFGANFRMAGVENGVSCFCDNQISNKDLGTIDFVECMAESCQGDSTEACGAFNLLLLYQL